MGHDEDSKKIKEAEEDLEKEEEKEEEEQEEERRLKRIEQEVDEEVRLHFGLKNLDFLPNKIEEKKQQKKKEQEEKKEKEKQDCLFHTTLPMTTTITTITTIARSEQHDHDQEQKQQQQQQQQQEEEGEQQGQQQEEAEEVENEAEAEEEEEEVKIINPEDWRCVRCFQLERSSNDIFVMCEMVGCGRAFHLSCADLVTLPPEDSPWYCDACIIKNLQREIFCLKEETEEYQMEMTVMGKEMKYLRSLLEVEKEKGKE